MDDWHTPTWGYGIGANRKVGHVLRGKDLITMEDWISEEVAIQVDGVSGPFTATAARMPPNVSFVHHGHMPEIQKIYQA